MKLLNTISTTNTRQFWIGLMGLVALLAIGVAAGLTRELYLDLQPHATAPAITVGVPAPLDLYERHKPANMGVSTPMDVHERHLTATRGVAATSDLYERHLPASATIRAPLDAHERHTLGVGVSMPAPLDLHERHRESPAVGMGISEVLDRQEWH
jgi:hypothetical protein